MSTPEVTRKHIVVSAALLGRVDKARGDIPWSRFATRALEAFCESWERSHINPAGLMSSVVVQSGTPMNPPASRRSGTDAYADELRRLEDQS